MEYDNCYYLQPALYRCKASGKERNGCRICDTKLKKGEEIVETFTSSFRGRTNYSNRFHLRCFLKIIGLNYPEIFNPEIFDEIKKEILVENLGVENE